MVMWPLLRTAVPGTSSAFRQVPRTSLTTNAWAASDPVWKPPPALQLPAEPHDTDVITAGQPLSRAAVPGTSSAFRQVPWTSLTTNACLW